MSEEIIENQQQSDENKLYIDFRGRIIEHLGIHMYQKPVAALAEMVSNAWDADATTINIDVPSDTNGAIVISDNGYGMTKEECQKRYLNVGYCRRDRYGQTSRDGRNVLGRKGIGKFAGFGIATKMKVSTVSKDTGEKTVFELDLNRLKDDTEELRLIEIDIEEYSTPNESRKSDHGTVIELSDLKTLPRNLPVTMARRFLLYQRSADFSITIDGNPLPENADSEHIAYEFPKDYTTEEKPDNINLIDINGCEWADEEIDDNHNKVQWRILFYKDTIKDEDLQGISIFSGIKIAQLPFTFELSGNISAAHALEYMTGQVLADFLDQLPNDLIATERQRINWELPETQSLKNWGQNKIRELTNIWKKRRALEKEALITSALEEFQPRLSKYGEHERKTITKAIKTICQMSQLSNSEFRNITNAILLSWEQGRLKDIIQKFSEQEDEMTAETFLSLMGEVSVISALNIAESVKTKLHAIETLKSMVERKELENSVRDFIADNPWLISQKWETFKKERGLRNVFDQAAVDSKINTDDNLNKRVDLVLSSGKQLLLIEFMRPGLTIDNDHLYRAQMYTLSIRGILATNYPTEYDSNIITYIVADNLLNNYVMSSVMSKFAQDDIFVMDWKALIDKAEHEYKDYIDILGTRAPNDDRMRQLL